jgi:hypothetical protein
MSLRTSGREAVLNPPSTSDGGASRLAYIQALTVALASFLVGWHLSVLNPATGQSSAIGSY